MGSSQHFTCPGNQMPPTMSPLGSNLSLLLLISFNFFFLQIMVMLCHEVLASDALDDYVGSQLAEATELRY